MFQDRRGRSDRRLICNYTDVPTDGCRRKRERRNILRQYHPQPWWLQTNYAEELQPPLLDPTLENSADDSTPTDRPD